MATTLNSSGILLPPVSDGLVLHLDAGNPASYPGTGTNWYDLSGKGNHFAVLSTAYNSGSGGYMDFNGSYGCAKKTDADLAFYNCDLTAIVWTRVKSSTTEWRTLFRGLSTGSDHQVIIESGGNRIGMYDGGNASGFNVSGYSQTSLPNYGTSNWVMMTWRWSNNTSPYYSLGINSTPDTVVGSITSANARFKHGICSIGAYNNAVQTDPSNASQYWGDIAVVQIYNRYLSANEIIQNYNSVAARLGATPTALVQSATPSDYGTPVSVMSYTTSGTFTYYVPHNCTKILVQAMGGGGGSAGYCESGGAGGFSEGVFTVTPGASYTVTIGGGGSAVGYYAVAGSGGTTSFGALVSSTGGGGANSTVAHAGGHGGTGSGGQVNLQGGSGTGHSNGGSHSQTAAGGGGFFGGPGGKTRGNNADNFSPAPGTGASGGIGEIGSSGVAGPAGAVVVYAFK